MTTATLAASLALLLSSVAETPSGASLEQRYLATRDDYIRTLERQEAAAKGKSQDDEPFVDHTRALKDLEHRLREVLGPVGVAGVTDPGAINLETLLRGDVGYGMLDGIRFRWGNERLLVTTRGLVDAYTREVATLPKDLSALAKSPAFYQAGCVSDVAITYFLELPVRPVASMNVAKAFLAAAWQDVGPWADFTPDFIVVFVARGDRVFVITSPLKDDLERFPVCKARWKEFEAKQDEARRTRDAGAQADPHPEPNSDEGVEVYARCYASALRTRPSFADLTHRAQALLERLSGPR